MTSTWLEMGTLESLADIECSHFDTLSLALYLGNLQFRHTYAVRNPEMLLSDNSRDWCG